MLVQWLSEVPVPPLNLYLLSEDERAGPRGSAARFQPVWCRVTSAGVWGYPRGMADQRRTRDNAAAMLAAAGITVTPEGKARARAKLQAARARWTPELDAKLREQLGLPARAA